MQKLTLGTRRPKHLEMSSVTYMKNGRESRRFYTNGKRN